MAGADTDDEGNFARRHAGPSENHSTDYIIASQGWLLLEAFYHGRRTGYPAQLRAATPVSSRTPTRLLDWQLRAGKAFKINSADTAQWIPYFEYGQHRWDRLNGGSIGDYSEYYRHSSIAIGAIGQYAPTEKLVLSAEAQLGRLYDARVRAPDMEKVLIDVGDGYYIVGPDGPIILNSHNVVSLGLGVDYAIRPGLHINANYRWQRFGYGRGVNNSFQEPNSITINQQIELGVALTF